MAHQKVIQTLTGRIFVNRNSGDLGGGRAQIAAYNIVH
jgi:hypothetical protein